LRRLHGKNKSKVYHVYKGEAGSGGTNPAKCGELLSFSFQKVGEMTSAFADILLRSVDRGLSVLGDSVRSSIYYHVERKHGLSRRDLAMKPGEFADALEGLFGAGTGTLVKMIVKELYLSVGLEPKERGDWKFSDYVAEANRIFKEQSRCSKGSA